MTEPKRNRTNSDIDDRTERDCVARGELAARNRGIIAVRWIDVMPRVEGPSLLRPGRSDERLMRWMMLHPGQEAGLCNTVQPEPRVKGYKANPKNKRKDDKYYRENKEKILGRLRDRRANEKEALKAKRSGS